MWVPYPRSALLESDLDSPILLAPIGIALFSADAESSPHPLPAYNNIVT
jgi:hypothetical protein